MHRPKGNADNGHKSVVREQAAATGKRSKGVRGAPHMNKQASEYLMIPIQVELRPHESYTTYKIIGGRAEPKAQRPKHNV